jgi:acetyl-CoA acetyltransferase
MRNLSTLLHAPRRRDGRSGLETTCIGGVQGIGVGFERA